MLASKLKIIVIVILKKVSEHILWVYTTAVKGIYIDHSKGATIKEVLQSV